jgi:excisionase family DNA binding protein
MIVPTLINNEKRYLNIQEAAQYLRISKWAIYKMVDRRQIPFIPIGRPLRFDMKTLDEWMSKRTIKAVNADGRL